MISIVIPTYNEEMYLPKLLECIKNQTYKYYEVIIADANSKDKTRLIAKKYGCNVVKGGLPAVGRNNGAKEAKGHILLFLDADTTIEKDFLKNALQEIKDRKLDAAAAYMMPLSNNFVDKIFIGIFNLWAYATQLFYPHAVGSGIFCKKWLHKKINGFDEKIVLAEDMDYVKRCSKHAKFRMLKGAKIYFSMRRYEKDGRLKVGIKIFLANFYRIFFGEIKTDIFKYKLKYKK